MVAVTVDGPVPSGSTVAFTSSGSRRKEPSDRGTTAKTLPDAGLGSPNHSCVLGIAQLGPRSCLDSFVQ
jgi:hypothetical protein